MTKQRILILSCILGIGGGASYWATRTADACVGCDSDNVAKEEKSEVGNSCSLDSHARGGVAKEYVAFHKKFLVDVQVSITNNYVGNKALLDSTLSRFIALESSCCAHLKLSKEETSDGYAVTVSGNRDAINELQFHLSSAVH